MSTANATNNNFALLSAFYITAGSLAALNSGEGYGNVITLKKYSSNGHSFPYISGQSIRFALRNSIRGQMNGNGNACIYNEDGHSCGMPDICVLCDLMGFMKAETKPKSVKDIEKEIKALEDKIEKIEKNKKKEKEKLEQDCKLLKASIPDAEKREGLSKAIKDQRENLKQALEKPGTLSKKEIEDIEKQIKDNLTELDKLNPRDKRQSPLQVSPLMGIVPLETSLTTDFLTCEKPGTMNKAIVNIEASKNIYMGAWALDLKRVGAYDLLDPVLQTLSCIPIYGNDGTVDKNIRNQRVQMLLKAFRNLTGFAKQARMMDSLEADIIVFCLSPVYSHLIIKLTHGVVEEKGRIKINSKLWKEVIDDLKENQATLYVGFRDGFLPESFQQGAESIFSQSEITGTPHAAYDKVLESFPVKLKDAKNSGG
jgi:hypothetical protein